MLEEIAIRGLGVIDEAVLELSPGLTVLTGETGAGKTMVMTALGLLLGGRADAGLVRPGAKGLSVEGRVRVAPDSAAATRATDAGGELDEANEDQAVLILARSVSAEGRSRAFVGGRSAPAALLGELAEHLVAVHGQHDQQHLRSPSHQRELLDRYAGTDVAKPLAAYRTAYDELREVRARLADITGRVRERAQEADLLRLGLGEIEAVAPERGEDRTLAAEVERLAHADSLSAAASTAHDLLLADPAERAGIDAATLVGDARRAAEAMAAHDPELAALAQRIAEITYLLADITADLSSYASGVEIDPARLQTAQERQAALGRLLRKYGDTVDEVLAWAATGSARLLELDTDTDTTDELRAQEARLRAELGKLASALSGARTKAGNRLAKAVTAELAGLAMPQARFTVAVRQTERGPDGESLEVGGCPVAFGRDGVNEIELLLAPHPGAPERPIQRSASGGELSRIMLAVQVVFAGADPVPTFVFDEVDAGVGGKAAVEVGRRLAKLARNAQVLVVTHLPQVAAFADHHLLVAKADDGRVTRTGVRALDGDDRVRELSRMLAGQENSATARAHAEELLAAAAAGRAG